MRAATAVQSATQAREVLKGIRYVLLDCDGVLWHGDDVIDGVPQALRHLKHDRGLHVRYITNNATMSRAEMIDKKFQKMLGPAVGVEPAEVVSSAAAAAAALRAHGGGADGYTQGNVLVLGNPSLYDELRPAVAANRCLYGLELRQPPSRLSGDGASPSISTTQMPYDMKACARAWDTPLLPAPSGEQCGSCGRQATPAINESSSSSSHSSAAGPVPLVSLQELQITAVVAAFDFCFCGTALALASMVLQQHERVPGAPRATFIATNRDPQISVGARGWLLPGNGSLVSALCTASGREPDVTCGKPSTHLFDLLLQAEKETVAPSECLMVGDRITTDIEFGNRAGARTLLVLTGCEGEADIPETESDYANYGRPDYVAPSLAGFVALLQQSDEASQPS